ncbi:hypothetical protein EMIT0P43_40056 [Pseudomonas jessenii]
MRFEAPPGNWLIRGKPLSPGIWALRYGSIRPASSSSPVRVRVDWSVSAMLIPSAYSGGLKLLANLMRTLRTYNRERLL